MTKSACALGKNSARPSRVSTPLPTNACARACPFGMQRPLVQVGDCHYARQVRAMRDLATSGAADLASQAEKRKDGAKTVVKQKLLMGWIKETRSVFTCCSVVLGEERGPYCM
eukprot:9111579-Pyramimonas_sp.AAC.1